VYLAAAVATAATTAVPLAMTPASGLALRPATTEPTRPYIVIARSRADARDLVGEVRWRVRRYYTAALPGFATFLTAAELAELRADPRVRTVEPDRQIHPMPVRRLARPLTDRATGAGVTVYVVDSGVDAGRPASEDQDRRASGDRTQRTSGDRTRPGFADQTWRGFADRTWRAFDATGATGRDCTGHGTQVAGRVHAAAPRAGIASVRVLGCDGTGTLADVLAGLDWIHRHARGPSVATLSLDGAGSAALGTAVRALVRSGVFVAGAADSAACRVGPDGAAYSAHAPHLAGTVARHLELHPGTNPAILASRFNCTSTRGAIRQNPSGASNLLMHSGGL
jgi:subtilisin family serine protease